MPTRSDVRGWLGFALPEQRPAGTLVGSRIAGDAWGLECRGAALGQAQEASVAAALAGAPRWLEPDLEREAREHGHARALLAAYRRHDAELTRRIAGTFLLAIVDYGRDRLLLASDRFGVMRCWFAIAHGGIAFATRPILLHELGVAAREIDPQGLYHYVYFHCVPSPWSIWRGLEKLRPAEILECRGGRVERRTYWIPQFAPPEAAVHRAALERDLLEALDAAVAEHCRPPYPAAFLSGGLDSSTVSGLLARHADGAATTFTVGFSAQGYDESGFARAVAQHFGTRHFELALTEEDLCEGIAEVAGWYDEPFGNSSAIPTWFCAHNARSRGFDALLAGDGGDELFAGNTRYALQKVFEAYARVPRPIRGLLEAGYAAVPWLRTTFPFHKGYRYIEQARMPLPDRMQSYNFLHRFDPETVFLPETLAGVDRAQSLEELRRRYCEPERGSALARMLYLDWKFTLADNDLVKVSGACALAGIDVAYPMLDPRVVEVALRVPDRLLLPGLKLRDFYRKAMRDFLPPVTLAKRKHGFGLPFGVWLRDHPRLQRMAAESLASLAARRMFLPAFLQQAQELHRREAAGYYGELVWILVVLEQWLRRHVDARAQAAAA